MLSNDKILGLWAEGRPQAPARPVLGSKKVVDFARAIERAAYERAAALVIELTEDSTTADAIRALGNQFRAIPENVQKQLWAKREPLSDEPTGAVYGIIDPDYGRVYTIARKLAWEEGYAIGLHGSFTRDLDMIAVPWTDTACEPEHLIRRIVEATGLKLRNGVGTKPHGRLAWTLLFPAFGDPRFVDLSVMPRIGGSDE